MSNSDIPKIIWQTHNYEYEDLPVHYKKIAQTWKNLNPDWEYRYVSYSERKEIIKKYPTIWKYYVAQDPVCQADIWRYIVTYENGGVYADMDSVCTKSISYLLSNVGDAEIFVSEPIFVERLLEDQINILKSVYGKDAEINMRLKVQIARNGVEVFESENGTMIRASTTKSSNYAVKKQSKIMEHIIKESELHFIENVKDETPRVKLYVPFLNVIHGLKDDSSVSFKFDAFKHDDLYKTDFNAEFWINDHGTMKKYSDYLKEYELPIC